MESSDNDRAQSQACFCRPLGNEKFRRDPLFFDRVRTRLSIVRVERRTAHGNEEPTMRLSKVAALALIVGAPSFFSASLARPASDCSILVTLANWGENSTGYIDLKSGANCRFPIRKRGVTGSDISEKPEHGALKRLDVSTFVYTAKARYKGSDTFVIKATGQGRTASGTSVITVHATIK